MDNSEIKVSVIIPVYNAESYLRECLDSVCAQTMKEIEIICVDDGSEDSSPAILDEYVAKDNRISVLRQQNQYAGVARNNGMKRAKGRYLMFWDADDFFELDALERMYNRSMETDADVCLCKACNYYTESNVRTHAEAILNMKYIPEEDVFNFESMGDDFFRFTTLAVWNKMVRREYLLENGIEFQAVRNANDIYFTTVELYLAKRITVVDAYLVNYRKLEDGSLTFSASKAAFSIIDAWISAYERIKKEVPNFQRSFANRALASLVGALHMVSDYEIFCELVETLKSGALERMGIVSPQNDFYFNKRYSDWLQKCLSLSTKEFHAYFVLTTFRSQLEQIQVEKTKKQDIKCKLQSKEKQLERCREKNLVKDDKIQRQSKKLQKQDEKIENQKRKIQKQSARLERQEKKIHDLEAQLEALRNSKSYRIGRMITDVPRNISSIWNKEH